MYYPHLYIHLPFCDTICHYCDFYVARSKEGGKQTQFFEALEKELALWIPKFSKPLQSIYFGGGTPSESPAKNIEALLKILSQHISTISTNHSRPTEITLEANPTSITEDNLLVWQRAGINRISIGVQSLQDPILKKIGRVHSRTEALSSIQKARQYFSNISCDLIYGIPSQTIKEITRDSEELASLGIQHLSAYTLTLEKKHFLYSKLPTSEFTMEQSEAIHNTLSSFGFRMYEASNYARAGFESRHNQCYWRGKAYAALGPSAHGYDGQNKRWKNISSWQEYVASLREQAKSPVDWEEYLTKEQLRAEYFVTRLRTKEGINFQEFQEAFSSDLGNSHGKLFQILEKEGYGHLTKFAWTPSFRGLMLADEISLKLLTSHDSSPY